jgi:hypothetical protein
MSGYQSFYTTADDTTAMTIFGALYYSSMLVLVIFLILVFVHFTISPIFALTANEPGIIVISGTADRELAYTSTAATPNTPRNTGMPQTALPDICNYTIGFDLRVTSLPPTTYPVGILYRAGLRNSRPAPLPPVTGYDRASSTQLSGTYDETNIIVSVQAATKKIQVTLVTTGTNGTVEKSMETPIEPDFAKPFRLAIVVADSFVEVYMNGSLKSTINTPNPLKQITGTDFYPPVVAPDVGGITLSNMSMWPRLLTSKEIRTYEAAPMTP